MADQTPARSASEVEDKWTCLSCGVTGGTQSCRECGGESMPGEWIERGRVEAAQAALYDQAIEIMENPPSLGTMRDLFDHRLGTLGHHYTRQGIEAIVNERDMWRAALEDIATRAVVERNPDGVDQAAHTMQLIAREALGMSIDG